MKMRLLLPFLFIPVLAFGQREASVHGSSVFVVSENDHITLADAKRKCIEKAQAEAIKQEFGEIVYTDVIDASVENNGDSSNSYFWENTTSTAKGEWLGQVKDPVIEVEYKDGQLFFKAEVWGMAREIVQAKVDLDISLLQNTEGRVGTGVYENGDRLYLRFKAPADGYLAVYLTGGNGRTSCLLPYPKDTDGLFPIRGGKEYFLFNKETDAMAQHYRLTTSHQQELNQLVIIYSPNPFVKCIDEVVDKKRPNSLVTSNFEKWLLKNQRADEGMAVNKLWLRIHNPSVKN